MSKPPEIPRDVYGQPVIPVKWYNPMTWDFEHKTISFGIGLTVSAHLLYNYRCRRPWFAGAAPALGYVSVGALAGWFFGWAFRKNLTVRDQVVQHYMELHPDDFNAFNIRKRRYKDVLLPWKPRRPLEKPIPWLKKQEWAEKHEK